MARKLLDTTFLIHHWGGRESVRSYLDSQPDGTEYVTTTINLKEIAVGRTLADAFDPEEIDAQFEWLRVVPITREAAWETAAIEARLRRDDALNRDRINSLAGDAVVAGAAAALDATVVTENVDDFRTLGVSAEPYG